MNNFKNILIAVLGVTTVAMTSGCQTQSASSNVRHIPNENIDASNPRARLVLGAESLLGNIAIIDPRFRQVGELSQAQISVQNLTDNRYTLEYRVNWEDAQGFKSATNTSWHRFTLTAKQLKSFTLTGKTPEASNIVFTVRLPNDVFINSDKQEK